MLKIGLKSVDGVLKRIYAYTSPKLYMKVVFAAFGYTTKEFVVTKCKQGATLLNSNQNSKNGIDT